MNNGSQTTTLLIVAMIGCFCMLSLLGLVWAYTQGHLDGVISWFKGEDTEAAPVDNNSGQTNGDQSAVDVPAVEVPADDVPADDVPSTTSGKGTWVCKQPWERQHVVFDTNGENPRCCKNEGDSYDSCQAGDALEVSEGWNDKIPDFYRYVKEELGGKIKGELWGGKQANDRKCFGPIGDKKTKDVDSIMYYVKNDKGHVTHVQCHPLEDGDGYQKGKHYPVYPACFVKDAESKNVDTRQGDYYVYPEYPGPNDNCVERNNTSKKRGKVRFLHANDVKGKETLNTPR